MFLSLRCFCFRFLYGKISSARRELNKHCADMKPAIRSTLLPSTIIEWKLLFVNFEWQFENRAQTFCSSDLAVDFGRKHINFSKQMEFPNWSAMFSWFIFFIMCVVWSVQPSNFGEIQRVVCHFKRWENISAPANESKTFGISGQKMPRELISG